MNLAIIIGGTIALGLRVFMLEFRLRSNLKFERHFLSRLLAYYTFLAMVTDLQSMILNLIVVCSAPMMLIMIFVFDIPFIVRVKQGLPVLPDESCRELTLNSLPVSTKIWLFVERLTLHTPMVILGTIFYVQGLKGFVFSGLNQWQYFVAMAFVFVPFILFDQRILKKKDWPEGFWLMFGGVCWAIGFYLHFFVLFF
ncbi:MAG: hypothetical protein ACTSVZ_10805 [Promethearchaeota archaeon]